MIFVGFEYDMVPEVPAWVYIVGDTMALLGTAYFTKPAALRLLSDVPRNAAIPEFVFVPAAVPIAYDCSQYL